MEDDMRARFSVLRKNVYNFTVTVILWVYYIAGFLVLFSPFYLMAFFFSVRREEAFQRLNHRLHRLFFSLFRILAPNVKWQLSEEVRALRSCMIMANHLSFLDPILLVSLFEKQKTVVKSDYFSLPVFGWILKTSGYIPSMAEGLYAVDMIDQIKNMKDYLSTGGNFFLFPEGTRSRDRRIGPFDRGAFKMARICQATPIQVVRIRNTDELFPPDGFLIDACGDHVIEVELAGTLEPDYQGEAFSLSDLMAETRSLMERKAIL